MRRLTNLFLLLFISSYSFSQTASVKGRVLDTLENKTLTNAVVVLLHKKDSVLYRFTRSNTKGEFSVDHVSPGQYIMMVTFPKFASYTDQLAITDNSTKDVGTLALTQAAKLLENVIVRTGSAVRIKGDTTEFAADSFAVREGATVEDLLKRIPGFQVDSKGNITAQGKRVDKFLVDGEEFFGDDPTMATQNIGARAVEKVQVYDTKSDQQAITGISSGNEGKTVNIKLKESAKKGAFGKVYAASDFQQYHDAKALYNKFVGKKKISVYGTKSTINAGSLSYQDQQKLGIESDAEYDEVNGYYTIIGGGDEFSDYNVRGLPNSYTAGGLFSNKWSADKRNVNTSYRYNRLITEGLNSTYTLTNLPNRSIINDRKVVSNAINQQHALNFKYEWKIDSLATIKFVSAGIHKTTESFNRMSTQSFNKVLTSSNLDSVQRLNESEQTRENETERKQIDNQLQYRQMFKKKNRLLLVNVRHTEIMDNNNGWLGAKTTFFDTDPPRKDSTDQLKKLNGKSRTIGTKATFSEPLSLKWNMVLDYSFNNNNSTSFRNTFNKSSNGKYEILDTAFSNNFDMGATAHTSNAIFRYMSKKLNAAMGSGLSAVQLRLNDLDNERRNVYNFINLTPQVQASYTLKAQTRVSLNYRGSTRQPRIDQLQPIRDNTDRLNIYQGNPNLNVGFNHNMSAGYNNYKVLKARYLYFNASYNLTKNAISNLNIVKRSGERIYTPVNTDGVKNWYISSVWQQGEGNKKLRKSVQLSANGGRNINFTDTAARDFSFAQKAINDYTNLTLYLGIGYSVLDKFSIDINPKIGYNSSKSSLQSAGNLNYYTYGGTIYGNATLGKFEIITDVNIDYRQRLPIFNQNTNIIRWNGSIARKVFKNNSGKVFIVANDILDQSKGYSRVINSNIVTDEQYLNISRYFLLKFEWTFNKNPGK